jgi:myosin-crossreactive antigen
MPTWWGGIASLASAAYLIRDGGMAGEVRSAQTAVYSLLGMDRPVAPLYKGQHYLKVDLSALRTLLR